MRLWYRMVVPTPVSDADSGFPHRGDAVLPVSVLGTQRAGWQPGDAGSTWGRCAHRGCPCGPRCTYQLIVQSTSEGPRGSRGTCSHRALSKSLRREADGRACHSPARERLAGLSACPPGL